MIDDPGFFVIANRYRDGFEAHRYGGSMFKTLRRDFENFQLCIGRVDRQQKLLVRCYRERPYVAALEGRKWLTIRVRLSRYMAAKTEQRSG